ncbi:hypothetical protein [Paraburkholderia pallida]|uniref:Uncharacterized protein n=1 Tax=Paraburkholderia pallida TaxID=2547399 RepID=A0A4P7D5N2_9BURK|nr:hypothetical protein [Paraburkholderia pallida]QBR04076.1 hypothetical protein E1956_43675 [Paraburkholderia pallida]
MEAHTEIYEGWTMEVFVKSRVNRMGATQFYIVQPVTYQEAPSSRVRQPAMEGHVDGPFRSAEEAFEAAFRDCRRDIDREINARKPRSDE